MHFSSLPWCTHISTWKKKSLDSHYSKRYPTRISQSDVQIPYSSSSSDKQYLTLQMKVCPDNNNHGLCHRTWSWQSTIREVRKSDLCTCGILRLVLILPFSFPHIFLLSPDELIFPHKNDSIFIIAGGIHSNSCFTIRRVTTPCSSSNQKKKRDVPCLMQDAPRLTLGIY